MQFFGRKLKEKPPRWWKHSKSDWNDFVHCLRDQMEARRLSVSEQFEDGYVTFSGGMTMGLQNVSEDWSVMPTAERRDHLRDFIDSCLRAVDATDRTSLDPSLLRISLYPCDYVANREPFLRRDLCTSFYAQVMIDMEDAAQAMCTSHLELAGLTEAEAFDIANENTWRFEPNNVDRATIKNVGQITGVYGDSMYTAAQVLHLDRFVVPPCDKGAILIVPNRNFFAFIRADDPKIEELVNHLATLAIKESSADYPVTSDLIWWKDGFFYRIGGMNNGRYEVKIPVELKR